MFSLSEDVLPRGHLISEMQWNVMRDTSVKRSSQIHPLPGSSNVGFSCCPEHGRREEMQRTQPAMKWLLQCDVGQRLSVAQRHAAPASSRRAGVTPARRERAGHAQSRAAASSLLRVLVWVCFLF